jgi:hypothetical protein
LRENSAAKSFVTGHDFSRAENASKSTRALAPATPNCGLKLKSGIFPRLLSPCGKCPLKLELSPSWDAACGLSGVCVMVVNSPSTAAAMPFLSLLFLIALLAAGLRDCLA